MGFITSLLCGSSDSESSKKQKSKNSVTSNNHNSKSGTGLNLEKSKSNKSGSPSRTNKKRSSAQTGLHSTNTRQSAVHTTLSNSTAEMHLAKKGTTKIKRAYGSVPVEKSKAPAVAEQVVHSSEITNDSSSDDAAMDVDVDMDADDDDDDDDIKADEKQTLLVYNAESDNSTGTTADTAVSAGQAAPPEITTTVHETEHTSSAEDSEGIQSQGVSDIDMVNADYDEGDLLDLSLLQPDQAHAPGVNTLLLPKTEQFKGKKCLVLDLDETLVHSSFKYLRTADFVIPVEIDNQVHNVYVIKRPGVDEFLKRVSELYEVVVFTASVSRYGDPLLDILDKEKTIHHRLFRDSCYNYDGNYIKNLSQIGRPLSDLIILDNSPASYIFHPQHAIPISSWFSDAHDNELLDIIPLLEDLAQERVPDVGKILDVTI